MAQIKPEDRQFYNWQFALAQRIAQIMEAQVLNHREFAKRARLTEAQISALLHVCANPNLSTLSRISALFDAELITWMKTSRPKPYVKPNRFTLRDGLDGYTLFDEIKFKFIDTPFQPAKPPNGSLRSTRR